MTLLYEMRSENKKDFQVRIVPITFRKIAEENRNHVIRQQKMYLINFERPLFTSFVIFTFISFAVIQFQSCFQFL